MTDFSLGQKAVWRMQHLSTELVESVWSVWFYEHLLDVLRNDSWRSFTSEAFGRRCEFDQLSDFLTSKDGLGWPKLKEVMDMIETVAACSPPPPPRKNEPADPPITALARRLMNEMDARGLTRKTATVIHGKQLPDLAAQGGDRRSEAIRDQGDVITLKPDRGTSQDYLLRRLKRDAPEHLEKIRTGEHTSVRKAAIAAGIIRDVPTVRLTEPERVAAKIRQNWTEAQINELCEALLM